LPLAAHGRQLCAEKNGQRRTLAVWFFIAARSRRLKAASRKLVVFS
jgi:hypothetical protein